MAKKNSKTCVVELPTVAFSQTRTAAAAWLYALRYEPNQDVPALKALLREIYPEAIPDTVSDLVEHTGAFGGVSDALVDDFMTAVHTEGYESLPWREDVTRILISDFIAALKSPSVQLSEDAIVRVTSFLDDKLRGTTKNAFQILAGQRTRLRRAVRSLVLAALYLMEFRKLHTLEDVREDLMDLVQVCPDPDFIVDEFPFDGFFTPEGRFNARGIYAFDEASRVLRAMTPYRERIDEIIQNSSKRWRLSRMSLIDLNILRLGTYELMFERATSPRSLINEAVELAKQFGAEQSKNFVNGILQQICVDNQINVG